MEKAGGFAVDFQHALTQAAHGIVHALLRHLQPHAVREHFHGLDVIEIFNLTDECNDIAARAAAEAVKRVILRVDVEGR